MKSKFNKQTNSEFGLCPEVEKGEQHAYIDTPSITGATYSNFAV
jgi:hypothetical protein